MPAARKKYFFYTFANPAPEIAQLQNQTHIPSDAVVTNGALCDYQDISDAVVTNEPLRHYQDFSDAVVTNGPLRHTK